MFKAAISEWKAVCTEEPAKNNERGEEKKEEREERNPAGWDS
jgi:hypothetical protein